MFGKKLETGMWGQREQQQIKKKNLKKKKMLWKGQSDGDKTQQGWS